MVFQFEHIENGSGDYGKWTTEKYDFNMIYNKNSPTSSGSEMNCRFEHKCS